MYNLILYKKVRYSQFYFFTTWKWKTKPDKFCASVHKFFIQVEKPSIIWYSDLFVKLASLLY